MNKMIPGFVSIAMKATLLAVFFFLTFSLIAQDGVRHMVPQPPRGSVPQAKTMKSSAESPGVTLKKNITIRLHGTTTSGAEIDLSLTGIGPKFSADQIINDDTMLTCLYSVSGAGTGYRVTYTVGTRVKVPTQTSKNTTTYEFRDLSISGTVLCSADRPQDLIRSGSKPLQLTITGEAESEE